MAANVLPLTSKVLKLIFSRKHMLLIFEKFVMNDLETLKRNSIYNMILEAEVGNLYFFESEFFLFLLIRCIATKIIR